MEIPRWSGAADAWFKLLAAVILGGLIIEHGVAVVRAFSDVAVIAIGGIFLAYFVFPLVSGLNRRLPLWAALTIVYAGGALALALVFALLVPTLVTQGQAFVTDLPTLQRTLEHALDNPRDPFVSRLPPVAQSYLHKLPAQITADLQRNASALSERVLNALLAITAIAAVLVAIPVVSIYMLAESAVMKRFFVRAWHPSLRQPVVAVLSDLDAVIGGFIRGQVIVAAVVAVLCSIALTILHVPYALLIGAWAGIADIMPYVGPFLGAIPAAIVAIVFEGPATLVGVVIAFTVVNQIEAHLLGPRIVASTVKVTPLAVIFALLIGVHVLGLFGLVISVPLAGIIRVALLRLFPERDVTNAELRPGLTHVPRSDLDPHATEA